MQLSENKYGELGATLKRVREASFEEEFDPIESIELGERKIDLVERLNEKIYDAVDRNWSQIFAQRSFLLRWYHLWNKVGIRWYQEAVKRLGSGTKAFRDVMFRYSLISFLVTYVKYPAIEEIVKTSRHESETRIPQVIRVLKTPDPSINYKSKKIERFMDTFLRIVFMPTGEPGSDVFRMTGAFRSFLFEALTKKIDLSRWMEENLDYLWASHTPLASLIVDSILKNYREYGRPGYWGMRVGVFTGLGGGKTSMSFYSLYSALRFVGLTRDDALAMARSLVTSNPVEIATILYEAMRRQVQLPAFIADDIVATISKWWFMNKAMKELGRELFRVLKISRELFGVLIFPADVSESLPKALRESIDLQLTGVKHESRDRLTTYTVWIKPETEFAVRSRSRNPFGQEEDHPRLSSRITEIVMDEITATLHPPLWIPSGVYDTLQAVKMKLKQVAMKRVRDLAVSQVTGGSPEDDNGEA